MKSFSIILPGWHRILLTLILSVPFFLLSAQAQENQATPKQVTTQNNSILRAKKINPTTVEVLLPNDHRMLFDFYGENIFRVFQDNSGGMVRDPESKPETHILVNNPRKPVSKLDLADEAGLITITTEKIKVQLDKNTSLLKVFNFSDNKLVIEEVKPVLFENDKVVVTLKENTGEYFYGGGVQNGRFSHKGKKIAIENQNSWTDGGVASPTPYYWSTNGYGVMFYTFKKGEYDFGSREKGLVKLSHNTNYLDVFYMISEGAAPLLNDYYQLTGNPILLPKFGFYEGHLNAYNRDYWKENETGILFEDGKRYKESQKDKEGTKESLNGEKNNYQFSARAVIDRYKNHDMPFGWILPNDGYGAGYGQTGTLDSNILNLKSLGDYARKNGVQIGLWTQSDLHPKPEISALLQRDIVKEVRDAGVRVLKTDVAWVGAGYSFGLHGISDAANIMSYYGSNSRPFIISLDGWAGTQRYAAIWSGDQTGGVWEYIRFHIPTYIGSGLSGLPNITSDNDGIFGGKNPIVNTRDFQWKAFTPMQLNMDGWGSNEKYPHALGEPTTSINRWYLKLKSQLIPYTYSIARESVDGLPIMRAMFLDYPNAYTKTKSTQYQFLYGPDFLVAPIYKETQSDKEGNDIRNGIYLPEGSWFDYFTGDHYDGNRILNNFAAPVWKLPVFVKSGAIIPMANPNNNVSEINKGLRIYEIYPGGKSSFNEYDDDGTTEAYKAGQNTNTLIESSVDGKNNAMVTIHATTGNFNGFEKMKSTQFRINVSKQPRKISAKVGGKKVKLAEVKSKEEFEKRENVFFYDATPNLNQFATKGSEFAKKIITKNPQLLINLSATDITASETILNISGFIFQPEDKSRINSGPLPATIAVQVADSNAAAYTLTPTWNKINNADFYEIGFNDMLYSTITNNQLLFEGLEPETKYSFKIRGVNKDGYSEWTSFNSATKSDPLEFAIKGIVGETTAENQGGSGIGKLFDFDESNGWHTKWGVNSIPLDLVMDLKTINQLDKFQYLPRNGGTNGILLKGIVYYSNDKETWTEAGRFEWAKNGEVKEFKFANHPTVRYIKLSVTDAAGGFGSGSELYVFKVPNTPSYLPGDINNDRLIDRNDLTSYINYTGLRKGDADFDGYISNGDINKNNLIDAYDISVLATQLDGGVSRKKIEKVSGSIQLYTAKSNYQKDENIEVVVKGTGLRSVNALSFALAYNPLDYEFVSVQPINMKAMDNLTNDRLHTNGVKSLYPTFVNVGDKEALEGTQDLFILKLKAKRNVKFDLKITNGFLVDKKLNTVKF